jgi:hypothetical protein
MSMQPNPSIDEAGRGQPDGDTDQDDAARRSRKTGGDAPAAASLEEREAVAEDRDPLFDSPDECDEE